MNLFEKILLGTLGSAAATLPVFVHSQQGILVLNASENLLGNILLQIQQQQQTQKPQLAEAKSLAPLAPPPVVPDQPAKPGK